jgi:hypothetical protein
VSTANNPEITTPVESSVKTKTKKKSKKAPVKKAKKVSRKVSAKPKTPDTTSGVPTVLKKRGYVPKPKAPKVEKRLVFHLHLPKSSYDKIQEASRICGLSMQEFVRRAAATAVFDMPA